jgi:hypothetical protein
MASAESSFGGWERGVVEEAAISINKPKNFPCSPLRVIFVPSCFGQTCQNSVLFESKLKKFKSLALEYAY